MSIAACGSFRGAESGAADSGADALPAQPSDNDAGAGTDAGSVDASGPSPDGGPVVLDGGAADTGAATGCQAYKAELCFDFDPPSQTTPMTIGNAHALMIVSGGYSPPNAAQLTAPTTLPSGASTFFRFPTPPKSVEAWSILSFRVKVGTVGNGAFVIATTTRPLIEVVVTCNDDNCSLGLVFPGGTTPTGSFSRGTFHEIRLNRVASGTVTSSIDDAQKNSVTSPIEDVNPVRFAVGSMIKEPPAPTTITFDDIWFQ
jgi:hypothetical protein